MAPAPGSSTPPPGRELTSPRIASGTAPAGAVAVPGVSSARPRRHREGVIQEAGEEAARQRVQRSLRLAQMEGAPRVHAPDVGVARDLEELTHRPLGEEPEV